MKRFSSSINASTPSHLAIPGADRALCGLPLKGLWAIAQDMASCYVTCKKCARSEARIA
jgi:hypothetical protein